MQQHQPLLPGQFRFDVVRKIGSGGFGRVDEIVITESEAYDVPVGTRWARKRLNAKWDKDPTARARFEREIAAVQQMSHPNIVTCAGQNLPGEPRFYIMPIYGFSLRSAIYRNIHTGDWRLAISVGMMLADALAHAHDAGYVHRDLKPENILYDDGGPPIIADWGLGGFVHRGSKVLQQLTRGGVGTEYYCSAEQWTRAECDARGDIYSLGMTLDELVTGKQRKITPGAGVRTPTVLGGGPDADRFNALLQQMTHPAASGRPSSMLAVSLELQSLTTPQLPTVWW